MLLLAVSAKSIVHDAPCGRVSNLAQRVAVPALWLPSLSSVPRGPARTGCSLQRGNTGACFVPLGTQRFHPAQQCADAQAYAMRHMYSPNCRLRAGASHSVDTRWHSCIPNRTGSRTFLTACRQFSRLSICRERCLSWASSCTTHALGYPPGTAAVREHPDQKGSDVPAPRHPARWRTP